MSIKVGDEAPDFTLYNSEQNAISLKDLILKSNVVLLFFPFAFTGTCTKELCSTRDEISEYENLNGIIVGISVDSIFSLEKFRQENELSFDLLSDFNKDVSKKYNSLSNEFPFNYKGVSKRSAFVINKQGIIKYVEILDDAKNLPDFNKIKQTLENCDK